MNKYLLLFLMAFAAVLWWRNKNSNPAETRSAMPAPQNKLPVAMAPCRLCGLHVPLTDAVIDPNGRLYCCAKHQHQDAR